MWELDIIKPFLIALALGALIGLEREYARYRKRGHHYAGIRTLPLIALFGALSAYLGDKINIWILILGIALTGTLILMAYFSITRKKEVNFGATSELAGFLTFFIGMLTYYNELKLAVSLAVIITLVLYARSALHHFAQKIREKELSDTLKFAVIAFVILPFLPNESYGPYGLFNPYLFWLIVVFISGISFAGYVLLKWFGEKGLVLTGILAGLVSSTMATISFAEKSQKEKKIVKALVVGVILANGVMFVRVLFELLALNQNLFWSLLLPFSILVVISAIFAYILWRRKEKTHCHKEIELSSPFRLIPALEFGAFFILILALVKIADVYLSTQGVYLVSFISGLANVDAITVSLSQLAQAGLSIETAHNGVFIALLTNVAVKGVLAYWLGRKEFGRLIVGLFAVTIAIGIGLMIFL